MKKTIAVIAFLAVPALASAQAGLNRIQFLALQQELRDQGCGVTNVDGRYGPSTRRAIATCAKKFNTANNAAALLAAMNIGFGPNDNPPAAPSGGKASGGRVAVARRQKRKLKARAPRPSIRSTSQPRRSTAKRPRP